MYLVIFSPLLGLPANKALRNGKISRLLLVTRICDISWGHQHNSAAALQHISNWNIAWFPQWIEQLGSCWGHSSLRVFGVQGPGQAALSVLITNLGVYWTSWTSPLAAAYSCYRTDHGNFMWAVSLWRVGCWHSEAAFIQYSIQWLSLGEHFLRHRQQLDIANWFMADLDWHDEILWLLLLFCGVRENNRVRLIHIIPQNQNRSLRNCKQARGLCGTAWCAELALNLFPQQLSE